MRLLMPLIVLFCLGGLLASCHPQIPMCHIGIDHRGHGTRVWDDHPIPDGYATVGRFREDRCSEIDAFVHSMRTARIQSGTCPADTEAFLRTIEIRNQTTYALRVSFEGHVVPEIIPPGVVSPSDFLRGAPTSRSRSPVMFCVYALGTHVVRMRTTVHPISGGTMTETLPVLAEMDGSGVLSLSAVVRSSAGDSLYADATSHGSRLSYRFPITLGEGVQEIAVEPTRSEAHLESDPSVALLAQVRHLSTDLAEATREMHGLEGDLEVSHAETGRERELRERAEATITEQIGLIRRLRRELRVSRAETTDLRTRLEGAEARMRTMVPQSVVDAIVAQRLGETEYRWAVRTLSSSTARGRSTSGFCESVLGVGVSALPGLFLELLGGPEGFLAGFALDMISGFAGDALSAVASPIIDSICR
jgi:hypothetical protein